MVGDPVKKVPAEEVKVEPAQAREHGGREGCRERSTGWQHHQRGRQKAAENIKVSESSANAIADAVVKEATVNGSSVEDTSAKEIAAKGTDRGRGYQCCTR